MTISGCDARVIRSARLEVPEASPQFASPGPVGTGPNDAWRSYRYVVFN
jgi:hypothetical protein